MAASIQMKVRDDTLLRTQLAKEQSEQIGNAALAIHQCLSRGGNLSSSEMADRRPMPTTGLLDCVLPPPGYRPIPAISLSMEPANITALANDVGIEVIFLRQLIAQARPKDVAIGISTSGGSRNIVMALEEARKRGLLTVALLGYDGGEIYRRRSGGLSIIVRSDYIPRIQEVQASAYHVIRETLEVLDHGEA